MLPPSSYNTLTAVLFYGPHVLCTCAYPKFNNAWLHWLTDWAKNGLLPLNLILQTTWKQMTTYLEYPGARSLERVARMNYVPMPGKAGQEIFHALLKCIHLRMNQYFNNQILRSPLDQFLTWKQAFQPLSSILETQWKSTKLICFLEKLNARLVTLKARKFIQLLMRWVRLEKTENFRNEWKLKNLPFRASSPSGFELVKFSSSQFKSTWDDSTSHDKSPERKLSLCCSCKWKWTFSSLVR